MFARIRKFLAPPVFEDEEKTRIARMLNVILWAALAIVLTSVFSVLVTPYFRETLLTVGSIALPILGSLVLMHRGRVQLAGGLFSFVLLVLAAALPILSGGVHSPMVTEFLVAVCVAGLLLRGRTPSILVGLTIAISGGVALAEMNGLLPPPFFQLANPLLAIMPLVGNTIMVAALLYLATSSLNEALGRARRNERDLAERNRELAERTRALETSTQVSRRLSTILDREQLVAEVVQQVQNAFNYYHVHIYLIDETTRDLVMAGGTGEAGRLMLVSAHRIPWGKGLTGRAAATNDVVLVPDVSQEEGWLPNPLLPETKSEVAVPIAVGERVVGVLDVQHDVVGGLGEADADLLQSIAGQVAIALQNARLFAEVRQRAEQEALAGRIAQQIQGATTVETTLQAAARELGRALGAQRASVQLEPTVGGDHPRQ